jgi:hypothetical protein
MPIFSRFLRKLSLTPPPPLASLFFRYHFVNFSYYFVGDSEEKGQKEEKKLKEEISKRGKRKKDSRKKGRKLQMEKEER